jgi:hypothetical protein
MRAGTLSVGSGSLPAHGQLRMGVREGQAIEAPLREEWPGRAAQPHRASERRR